MDNIGKIIVLFLTHLDIGFTDFSENVIEKYNKQFIPNAIKVGEEIAERNIPEGFVWSTGSWLPWQYLRQASPAERAHMENAIKKGILKWHGMPFTMHSELCDEPLYNYGLSLFKELDEKFGIHTISGKLTDVPGHTKAIVPLLADAGIEFLHIGVNPASSVPEVPKLFRWQFDGREITVMYNKGGYGGFTVIPGTDTAVYFAHTGDNLGPQSADAIIDIYADLHEKYPNAVIKAGDLNEVAIALRAAKDKLPIVNCEIGDTWIHGGGTDPVKVASYRYIMREAHKLSDSCKKDVYNHLLMVPEHTWGLNENTHLKDNQNYIRPKFEKMRNDPRYLKMEKSWQEQRNYITAAAKAAGSDSERLLDGISDFYNVEFPKMENLKPVGKKTEKNGWSIEIDNQGAVCGLEHNGTVYADKEHRLGTFFYEAFSEKEVLAFDKRYLLHDQLWALEDFGKIGLQAEMPNYYSAKAENSGVYEDEKSLYVFLNTESRAKDEQGCPHKLVMIITPGGESVNFEFRWAEKPANRVPEAIWLGFCPTEKLTGITKIGREIDPFDVASKGARELHATEGLILFGDTELETLDAPLIAVEKPSCYSFRNEIPTNDKGIFVCLYNNQWGTNFPMWCDDNAKFRFILRKKQ